MTDWLDELVARDTGVAPTDAVGCGDATGRAAAEDRVLISIVRTQGSCPRDAGTRMLVSPAGCTGTIGGGHLEYRSIAIARELLAEGSPAFRIERFALGARLGQCCGGVAHVTFQTIAGDPPDWVTTLASLRRSEEPAVLVTPLRGAASAIDDMPDHQKLIVTSAKVTGCWLDASLQRRAEDRARDMLCTPGADRNPVDWQPSFLCERIDTESLRVAVFGAGHVGKALVATLASLPCRIDWIDSREDPFPASVASNVTCIHSDHPEDDVADLQPGTCVVIMTHSHAIDQRLCEAALKRGDLSWCGLIGSSTKRTLFERRLQARGVSSQALSRLTCPIGVTGISGKHPAQIAISVAAQILQNRQMSQQASTPDRQTACS